MMTFVGFSVCEVIAEHLTQEAVWSWKQVLIKSSCAEKCVN